MKKKVIVGISGGVDSAVAAALLVEQGYEVIGVFMKNWDEEDSSGACTVLEDYDEARSVCQTLNIPYYTFNFTKEYKERVFSDFLCELQKGRTPNPDVLCNREIKFASFLDMAEEIGADYIATGHYANVDYTEKDGYRLLRGLDPGKDQSYFLYMIGQRALSKAIFPVGNTIKTDVRQLARNYGLPNSERKDSTGICFIGERNFNGFVSQYLSGAPGDMVTPDGKVVGRHNGLIYYTIGQRKGIRLGGGSGDGRPWFVAQKNPIDNTLVVVQGHDAPELYKNELFADTVHFISDKPFDGELDCTCKIRYRQPDQKCHVVFNGNECHVTFEVPQRAVTPGQSVVFYDGEVCLGGAIINN